MISRYIILPKKTNKKHPFDLKNTPVATNLLNINPGFDVLSPQPSDELLYDVSY
jgi:hypothetical protein